MSEASEQRKKVSVKTRLLNFWIAWRGFFLFIVLMLIFRSVFADWNHVPSGSMNPGIVEGDRVVVDKIAYDVRWPFTRNRIVRWGHPERGDIVTFPSPDTQDAKLLIKRLIAIPGDTIELRQNHLWINGVEATYTEISPEEAKSLHLVTSGDGRYFREEILGHSRIVKWTRWMNSSKRELWNYGPETLPEGHYFLMGDNRDNSRDSRKIGSIERDRIIGRAHTISFSFAGPLILNPRLERFFTSMN